MYAIVAIAAIAAIVFQTRAILPVLRLYTSAIWRLIERDRKHC